MISFRDAAADLLLGSTCPGCRSPGWGLCAQCLALLKGVVEVVRRRGGLYIAAARPYRPVLEHVIPRYKDDGALHLERVLGKLLAGAVSAGRPPADALLVPVPSIPGNVRKRGFDHCRRLARSAARITGLQTATLLRRGGRGTDQAGLRRSERTGNVALSMTARITARPVVIVDDIVTTGASLEESRRALEMAGVEVLGAAVIAHVNNRPPRCPRG